MRGMCEVEMVVDEEEDEVRRRRRRRRRRRQRRRRAETPAVWCSSVPLYGVHGESVKSVKKERIIMLAAAAAAYFVTLGLMTSITRSNLWGSKTASCELVLN